MALGSTRRRQTLTAARAAEWDAFVARHPAATFFHRAGWRTVLERAFGHRPYFLFAERDGQLCGVLPLGHIRSRLFGNSLISTPFCVYGGAVAETPALAAQLEDAACDLARQLRVDQLELRNLTPRRPDWPRKTLYVTFRKSISADPDENLRAIPRKQRAMVRKGEQAGLVARFDAPVEEVHRIYAESVRNLGTPLFSLKYFRVLKDVFGADCETLTIHRLDGVAVAGVLSFYFRDEVLPYYGGGTAAAREIKANDFMYWALLRHAAARGIRVFDYGRSKQGTGSFDFKRNWGFVPQPLSYEFFLVRAKTVPEINPLNPKYRLFIEAWRRLPLPVSRLLGPWLSRQLG